MTFSENFPENVMVLPLRRSYTLFETNHVLHVKCMATYFSYKGGTHMNIKKRLVALCLAATAALSFMFAASAKQAQHADSEQAVLLCDSYEEIDFKRC